MTPDEIKALRAQLDYSQEEMARALGVSFATVNRWERGHTQPAPLARAALVRLARKARRKPPRQEEQP